MKRVSTIVTAPDGLPVTLTEAKTHMGVTFDTDDTAIGIYLSAAVSLVEQTLQRKLITQTWKMYLDYWPNYIKLHFGNLQSVTHIKYTDIDDTQSEFSPELYYVDTDSIPGRVLLKDSESWPTDTLRVFNPIEIQFITGYGDSASNVPDDIRNAILLTTSHFYENRENLLVSNVQSMTIEEIPWTSKTLLMPHRIWDWIL